MEGRGGLWRVLVLLAGARLMPSCSEWMLMCWSMCAPTSASPPHPPFPPGSDLDSDASGGWSSSGEDLDSEGESGSDDHDSDEYGTEESGSEGEEEEEEGRKER